MINVIDYIKLVLKKKKWSQKRLCDELNKIELKIGDKKTNKQNISNYFNGQVGVSPKTLMKYEKALGLVPDTLLKMVQKPVTKDSQKELKEFKKKMENI